MTTTVPRRVESVGTTWQHLPALDGLRALAVTAVLLFHGGYLTGGFLGVDLFFALSGYLITSLLIRDAELEGIALRRFWGRRFRRLLPAVFTMIAVVALWSWWFGTAADLDGVKSDGPWAVLYLANWHLIGESAGYWASFSQPSMFDHLWSLAIEEQFYVLWPLVVLAVWRWSRRPQRALATVCAVGAVASLATMVVLYSGGDPTRVYMGTDTRASSLLVGALVATVPVRRAVRRLWTLLGARLDVFVALVGGLVLASWAAIDGASSEVLYRGGLLTHSVACALLVGLVATASTAGSGPARSVRVLGWRPLAWVGTLSYGLYLWHWPIYVVVSPERAGFDGPGLLSVRLGLSFAAAIVSLRLVENPIRYRAVWARGRRGAVALVLSISALLTMLVLLPEPATEIARFEPTSLPTPATPETPTPAPDAPDSPDSPEVTEVTAVAEPADEDTPTAPDAASVPSVAPAAADESSEDGTDATPTAPEPAVRETISTVLWAGDSVAADLALGVEASLGAAGVPVDPTGAFPGIFVTADGDRRLSVQLPPKLGRRPADTVIMLLSGWDTEVDSETYRTALVELVDTVVDAGAKRMVLVTAPSHPDDERDRELHRLADVAAAIARDDERVHFIDSSAVWTSPDVLDANGDGAPERRRDGVHLCPAGSAGFAAWLVAKLATRFDGLAPVEASAWAAGPWTTDPRYDEPVGSCAPV